MLVKSMKIYLSVRILFGSLKPGVSISVILPFVAILTFYVTVSNDLEALNWIGMSFLDWLKLVLKIDDTFDKKVDLP